MQWMNNGVSFGDLGGNAVMVGDNCVDARGIGFGDLMETSDATIDGDDEADLFGNEFVDEFFGKAIAVGDAIGQAIRDCGAAFFQSMVEQSARTDAVDIVVAKDDNAFVSFDCLDDAVDGAFHVAEKKGVVEVEFVIVQSPIEFFGDWSRGFVEDMPLFSKE